MKKFKKTIMKLILYLKIKKSNKKSKNIDKKGIF